MNVRVSNVWSRISAVLTAALLAIAVLLPSRAARAEDILVFAAASLKNALDEAGTAFERESGVKQKVSYAASSALAKQIESGVAADVFVSADLDWMDYVAGRNLIKPATRANLLRNRLVLVAPAARAIPVTIAPGFPLASLLGNGRLVMGDPAHVPAGKYGQAALESLGVWKDVEPKIARAENVRAALILVARDEAPFGIVYSTDAAAEPQVRVVGTFPAETHPPIVYPIALTVAGKHPAAERYLAFLKSGAATAIFSKHGFAPAE